MIYLDNSSTTRQKPQEVINAFLSGITKYSANPGRSGHKLSIDTANKIAETRQNIANFFNLPEMEKVIFTSGCTESLNLAILGYAKQGGHVIATVYDHNSTLRPLFELERKGVISLTIIKPKLKDRICLTDIENEVKDNTYMIVNTHVSNVDGAETELDEIGQFCSEHNILYLVDAAQSAGHKEIDMQKQHINLLAIAGHKGLLASQGVGALLINSSIMPKPIKFGGTGTESASVYQPDGFPECYESGTGATPNILSLNAGINFVRKNQVEYEKKLKFLTSYTLTRLKEINNIVIYTSDRNLNGVVAFNFKDVDSSEVSSFLDEKFNICVRSGLQCAPLKHQFLGTTNQGIVRASLSYFSTQKYIDVLIKALKTFSMSIA